MNLVYRRSIVILTLFGCITFGSFSLARSTGKAADLPAESIVSQNINREIDFGRHFQELGIEGSIVIYDAKADRSYQHNPQRNETAFLPGSTFKILNALIALETGVMSDSIQVLTWDGIQRKIPQWNRDLNMKEAMKFSAVWFYQVIARRIGYDRMREWVSRVGYGNQNIGNREDVDKFWLEGELRITPQQQIQFLQRFYREDFPFSQRTFSIVKDMTIVEQTPDYSIHAKTGWVGVTDNVRPQIGWYVGYLEKGENVYFFATNIEIRQDKDAAARLEITRRCFKDLGLL